MAPRNWIALAALLAGLGVVAGAFGAHALEGRLVAAGHLDTWETAVRYQVWHALALFAWALHREAGGRAAGGAAAAWCFFVGALFFSGSLYGLALMEEGGLRTALGPITPLGGAILIVGWGIVATGALRSARD